MQQAHDSELVPLKTGFDVAWRGFDRVQVREHLDTMADDIRLLTADRDAALSQVDYLTSSLERARTELDALRTQLDAVCRGPVNGEQLSQRLQRMLELANAEAAEITSRAQTMAEHIACEAHDSAERMLRTHRAEKAQLDARRVDLEREHRETMRRAKAEIEQTTAQADARRAELDTEAKRRRASEDEDFRIAQTERRRTVSAELDRERADAAAEAARTRADARAHAAELVAAAEVRVEELDGVRGELSSRLGTALELMREAGPLIANRPELAPEHQPEPQAVAQPQQQPAAQPTPRPKPQPTPREARLPEPKATVPESPEPENAEVTGVPQQPNANSQHSATPPNKRLKANRKATSSRGR